MGKNLFEWAWKGYKFADESLIDAADVATRAYNWTTGDTRAGLAKKLLTVGAIVGSVTNILVTPFILYGAHFLQKNFDSTDDSDRNAAESGMRSLQTERLKKGYEVIGNMNLLFESVFFAPGFVIAEDTMAKLSFAGGGFFLGSLAASCYVMRSDYLPPKKNFLSRGTDKLVDMVRGYRESRVLTGVSPALANPGFRRRLNLD